MKTIAVLVQSLTIEYSISILNGIIDYFKKKDVKVIISQVKGPNYDTGLYEYQEWTSVSLLYSQQVDGIIVLTGSFNSTMHIKDLETALLKFPKKPVVSIGAKLNLSESTSLITENTQAYDKIITHMIKTHKCHRFAFLGPDPKSSEEGRNRYEAFLQAIKKNNLSFDPEFYFRGNFTTKSGENAITNCFKKKSEIKFDCLVCANDLMAIGAKNALWELGVKIPDQVKLVGFDNTTHSKIVSPVLTTIDQNFFKQGFEAAQAIYKKINRKNVSEELKIFTEPVIRESCGCDYKNRLVKISKRKHQLLSNEEQNHFLSKLAQICVLFDINKVSATDRQVFYALPYMLENAKIERIVVCKYNKPIILGKKDEIELPVQASVSMFIDNSSNITEFEPGIIFNPEEELIPYQILTNCNGNYIIYPLYSGEVNYGYVICKLLNDDFAVTTVFIKIITNALSQAYEYTDRISENKELSKENKELQENNTTLKKISKTDELTHLLNRRGFMEMGQDLIDLAMESGDSGLVFFADLDNLKIINDSFGHKLGDAAIKAMGSVLSQILRANDVVGRLSGDEFGGVATGMGENLVAKMRKEAEKLCSDISKQHQFPFTLSFSIGFSKFNKENHSLKKLLEEADKTLYKQKQIHHQQKNH